jgi:hypothetical protein
MSSPMTRHRDNQAVKRTAARILDRALEPETMLKSWHHGGGEMKRWVRKKKRRHAKAKD